LIYDEDLASGDLAYSLKSGGGGGFRSLLESFHNRNVPERKAVEIMIEKAQIQVLTTPLSAFWSISSPKNALKSLQSLMQP